MAETKEEAQKLINQLVSEAYSALEAAQALAQVWECSFDFSPAYGMGGTYYGYPDTSGWNSRSGPGWVSSSDEC